MSEYVYDPAVVESRWQAAWDAQGVNRIDLKAAKNPFYVLMMFPYPSAEGLHVGNVYAFTGADIYGRHRRLRGYDVFEPIGFDAFGIHSENYAMKVNRHPAELIPANVANFTRQLRMMGLMFDWDQTVDTTSPAYYKWTQWIFLQLYKAGLAYRDTKEVNFCPDCGTVISDEQVNTDGTCERHPETVVQRRPMPCWFFRITEFADRLSDNHDWLDWSERTRIDQRRWIGKSEGAEVDFALAGSSHKVRVFTTRPDTLFGATYMVMAPDHPLVDAIATPEKRAEIAAYRERIASAAKAADEAEKPVAESISIDRTRNQRNEAAAAGATEVDPETIQPTAELLAQVPADFARRHGVFPVSWAGSQLTVAMTDVTDADVIDELSRLTEKKISRLFAPSDALHQLIAKHYGAPDAQPIAPAGFVTTKPEGAVPPEGSASEKEKTGVDIGARAINPLTGEQIPVFISDYVLMGYGTGAIMAVPAHDERDFEFARRFNLPIRAAVDPQLSATPDGGGYQKDGMTPDQLRLAVLEGKMCWPGPGVAINSASAELSINGLSVAEAKKKTTEFLEQKGLGKARTTFRLRDWGISRQRYWGPPIPIVYDEEGNAHPVPEDQLPVELPPVKEFRPKGDGRGPLAHVDSWVNVTLPDGRPGRRETDVMDNFLDSAWYYLRYISTADDKRPYDPELIRKWLPVDIYIGGNEHAVLHLMYTRFITMALEKAGVLQMGASDLKDSGEPFRRFRAHGLLLKDGAKMSKSRGNVVNPDKYVAEWGADTVRLYLMFLGPYQQGGDFRDKDIQGMRRFLNRLAAWYFDAAQPVVADEELPRELRVKTHQTIRKVREDIDNLSYNTAIAAVMELFNEARSSEKTSRFVKEAVILALAPFAPHFAEEIWQGALGHAESIWTSGRYPEFQAELTQLDTVEIALQFGGKVRDRIVVSRTATQAEIEAAALANEKIVASLAGRAPKKVIVVPGRLVNVIG